MGSVTIAQRLADYSMGLEYEALPDNVVHEAKRRLVDSLACMLGASDSAPFRAAVSAAPQVSGGARSTILGRSLPTTPEHAAFANGVLVRYLDFNDTYLSKEPAHPSDNIAPALAAAEAAGSGGRGLITAIVAAYELQCRLCDAASLRARGWDHVAYGAFSATAAASMLLGLDRAEFVNALNIAGTMAPALRQSRAGELSMWKGCAFANASRNALFAAMMARGGMTGPAPVFEGEFGFERLVSGPIELAPAFGGEGGQGFRILDTCVKPYPAEYHSQSAIAAAIELGRRIDDPSSIESVLVSTFGAAFEIIGSGPEKWRPATREAADHSLPFLVAAALLDGNITLATYSERMRDESLLELVRKVRVEKDEELDRMYPDAIPNRVEVTVASGQVLSAERLYPRGHPKDPMTDLELEDKFRRLGAWCLEGRMADEALRALWKADEAESAGDLLALFYR